MTTGGRAHTAYVFKVVSWLPSTKGNDESKSPTLIQHIREGKASRRNQQEILRCIREDKALPPNTTNERAKIALYSAKSEAAKVARAALQEVIWNLRVCARVCA